MSVRYTATWYDVMQARQQEHLSSHTLTQLQLGQWVRWCDRVKMTEQCVVICS